MPDIGTNDIIVAFHRDGCGRTARDIRGRRPSPTAVHRTSVRGRVGAPSTLLNSMPPRPGRVGLSSRFPRQLPHLVSSPGILGRLIRSRSSVGDTARGGDVARLVEADSWGGRTVRVRRRGPGRHQTRPNVLHGGPCRYPSSDSPVGVAAGGEYSVPRRGGRPDVVSASVRRFHRVHRCQPSVQGLVRGLGHGVGRRGHVTRAGDR